MQNKIHSLAVMAVIVWTFCIGEGVHIAAGIAFFFAAGTLVNIYLPETNHDQQK